MLQEINEEPSKQEQNPNCESSGDNTEDFADDGFINESVVSVALDNIYKLCEFIKGEMQLLKERLSKSHNPHAVATEKLEQYLKVVAECQKQTAEIANGQLEHYALHPAIEVVDLLARLIEELYEQAAKLIENHEPCLLFQPVLDSIANAARVAQAKLGYLGIEMIEPQQFDGLDPNRHEIQQTIPTHDKSRHKQIVRTLVAGLIYRGKVLRPAKVAVYHYNQTNNANLKGKNDGKESE